MQVNESNAAFFSRKSLQEAKDIILTPNMWDTALRWRLETTIIYEQISKFIPQKARVLDFGTGIGRLPRCILRRRDDVHLVGVDSSPLMLGYAREYIPAHFFSAGRMRLATLDEFLSFPAETFDLVLAVYVLQHVSAECLSPVIQALNRCLKPDGVLFVLNGLERCAVDPKTNMVYDDGLDIQGLLAENFLCSKGIVFRARYMQMLLESHFCRVYFKTKSNLI